MGSDDSDGDRLDRAARQLELARSAPHFGVARAIFLGLVAELAASGGVPDLAECPDENALAAYVCALLSLEEIAQVERHLGKCPDCLAVVAAAAKGIDLAVAAVDAARETQS